MLLSVAEWPRRMAIAAGLCAGLLIFFAAPDARADQDAEAFVRGILGEANDVFEAQTQEERFDGIAQLVDKYVDMRRVGLFVLGQYARQITDEQKEVYFPLFKKYATKVYQNALEDYSGERLEVTNSVDRSPRDIIVNSRVVGVKPGDQYADLVVHWRVYRDKEGTMFIFDAGADQVWLAIEQQAQFKSVIANNGGGAKGIDALIEDLGEKVDD
jgi:phospholipid transport system substrate-binding protein